MKARWLLDLLSELAAERRAARHRRVKASQKHYNSHRARRGRRLRWLKRKRGTDA